MSMVSSVGKRGGAGASVDYVMSKGEHSLLLVSTCGTTHQQSMIEAFEREIAANMDLSNPIFHASISLSTGEELTNEQWKEVAWRYVDHMGYGDSMWIAVRHTDTDHEHIHIVASRVDMRGRTVSDSWDWPRSEAAMRVLEREYGLSQLPTRAERLAARRPTPEASTRRGGQGAPVSAKTQARYHYERQHGRAGAVTRIEDIVRETSRGESVAAEVRRQVREDAVLAWRTRLGRRGVDVRIKTGSGSRGDASEVVGVVYELEGFERSGGKIGPGYSLTGLTEHFGPITVEMWDRVSARVTRELEQEEGRRAGEADSPTVGSAQRPPVRPPEYGGVDAGSAEQSARAGDEAPGSPEVVNPMVSADAVRVVGRLEVGEPTRAEGMDPVAGSVRGGRTGPGSMSVRGQPRGQGGEVAEGAGPVVEERGPRVEEIAAALAQTASTRRLETWLVRLSVRGVEVVPEVMSEDTTKVCGLYLMDRKTGEVWEASMVDPSMSWQGIQARFGVGDYVEVRDLFEHVMLEGGDEVIDGARVGRDGFEPEQSSTGAGAGASAYLDEEEASSGAGDEEDGEGDGEALEVEDGDVLDVGSSPDMEAGPGREVSSHDVAASLPGRHDDSGPSEGRGGGAQARSSGDDEVMGEDEGVGGRALRKGPDVASPARRIDPGQLERAEVHASEAVAPQAHGGDVLAFAAPVGSEPGVEDPLPVVLRAVVEPESTQDASTSTPERSADDTVEGVTGEGTVEEGEGGARRHESGSPVDGILEDLVVREDELIDTLELDVREAVAADNPGHEIGGASGVVMGAVIYEDKAHGGSSPREFAHDVPAPVDVPYEAAEAMALVAGNEPDDDEPRDTHQMSSEWYAAGLADTPEGDSDLQDVGNSGAQEDDSEVEHRDDGATVQLEWAVRERALSEARDVEERQHEDVPASEVVVDPVDVPPVPVDVRDDGGREDGHAVAHDARASRTEDVHAGSAEPGTGREDDEDWGYGRSAFDSSVVAESVRREGRQDEPEGDLYRDGVLGARGAFDERRPLPDDVSPHTKCA